MKVFMKQAVNTITTMAWREIFWQRPIETETVEAMITHLSAHSPKLTVVWEIRGYQGQIRHFIGTERNSMGILMSVLKSHGDVRSTEIWPSARLPVNAASQLISTGVV